jgi:folylpolyglutamate synthase
MNIRDSFTDDNGKKSYQSALEALMSPLHQATSKEAIQKSAERRLKTIHDMRYYWNKIVRANNNGADHKQETQPKYKQKLIHITGTKGKGSTACMAEAVLRNHGYSTGLFTSPHLIDIRERIRWNGKPIHPNIFARVYWKIREALERTDHDDPDDEMLLDPPPVLPGFFRMLTLMGLYTFLMELADSGHPVDIIVMEVGIGGRYDATNFLDQSNFAQVACGVALLDLDHTRILGDTLEKIGWEKGGIFAMDKTSCVVSQRPTDHDSDPETRKQYLDDNDVKVDASNKFCILDCNTSGVLNMMASCARIEGQGGRLQKVDAAGRVLKEALQDNTNMAMQHWP